MAKGLAQEMANSRTTPNPNGEPARNNASTSSQTKVTAHINELQSALKLTTEQQQYWDSYYELVKVTARDRNQVAAYAAKAADVSLSAMERIDARRNYLSSKLGALNKVAPQAALLYQNLTPEQKKIADQLDLDPEGSSAAQLTATRARSTLLTEQSRAGYPSDLAIQPNSSGYPQKLWISLWMNLSQDCQKGPATHGLWLWLKLNHGYFIVKTIT